MPADTARAVAAPGRPGSGWASRLRLMSGLVLMTYVVMHLLNHALGLVSLEAMDAGRPLLGSFWVSMPGELLLLTAFATHLVLGLARLWQRRTWRMPVREALQLLLALLIPVLGTLHVLGARWLVHCCDVRVTYPFVLLGLWPDMAWRQTAFTLAVWLHGCIGLHAWLRLKAGYGAWRPWLLVAAVLVPVLGLLGFVNGGREVARRIVTEPDWVPRMAAEHHWPDLETVARLYRLEAYLVLGFLVLVGAVGTASVGRQLRGRLRDRVRIAYDGGLQTLAPRGMTLLDALKKIKVLSESVLAVRNGEMILDDEILKDGDVIKLVAVISGGAQ